MTEEEYEKKVKGAKTFCIIIGILFILSLVINLSQQNYINAVLSIGFLVLLCLFYFLIKKKKIAGPIIGIVLASLYILQLNILSIIIGIFVLVDSIAMLKYIKENKYII